MSNPTSPVVAERPGGAFCLCSLNNNDHADVQIAFPLSNGTRRLKKIGASITKVPPEMRGQMGQIDFLGFYEGFWDPKYGIGQRNDVNVNPVGRFD